MISRGKAIPHGSEFVLMSPDDVGATAESAVSAKASRGSGGGELEPHERRVPLLYPRSDYSFLRWHSAAFGKEEEVVHLHHQRQKHERHERLKEETLRSLCTDTKAKDDSCRAIAIIDTPATRSERRDCESCIILATPTI